MKPNHKTGELLAALATGIWAVQPQHLAIMITSARMMLNGGESAAQTEHAASEQAAIEAARRQQISASTGGSVVVLPLYGLITQKPSWYGGTSVEGFTMQFRQALADPNVTAIVIDVDSPGGSVSGIEELADEIFAARPKKTIIAISNTLNASAAYFLSSQASEMYVTPSSLTGSIGVYNAHQDVSEMLAAYGVKITLVSAGRFKVEGNPYEPLSADAQAAMQSLVDGFYASFVKSVARGRKAKVSDVKAGYGEGRVLMADDAISSGMADKVGTLDTVLARFGVQRNGSDSSFYGEAGQEAPAAESPVEVPVAAKKADPDPDDDDEDVDDNDGDDIGPCACECDSCVGGDCSGCTTDDCDADGCSCKADKEANAKATADHDLKMHLQRRRIALAGEHKTSISERFCAAIGCARTRCWLMPQRRCTFTPQTKEKSRWTL